MANNTYDETLEIFDIVRETIMKHFLEKQFTGLESLTIYTSMVISMAQESGYQLATAYGKDAPIESYIDHLSRSVEAGVAEAITLPDFLKNMIN